MSRVARTMASRSAQPSDDGAQHRWRGRPVLGGLTRALTFVGPVVVGIVTSSLLLRLLVHPTRAPWTILWWLGAFAVSTGAVCAADRLFRRLMPVAAMFRLTLLFPDRAPS